jgi:hypothetical protein
MIGYTYTYKAAKYSKKFLSELLSPYLTWI